MFLPLSLCLCVCECVPVCGPQADSDSSVLAICWQSHQEKATAAKQWRAMTGQDLWGVLYACVCMYLGVVCAFSLQRSKSASLYEHVQRGVAVVDRLSLLPGDRHAQMAI